MPKTITSPVKEFPGTITLKQPLMMEEALALEEAIDQVREMQKTYKAEGKKLSRIKTDAIYIPALCLCIEKAEIAGLDEHPQKIPFTPRLASARFISWLVNELMTIYIGEREESDPNA